MDKPLISVVAPVFNEQEVVNDFYNRLTQVLQAESFEIVFVDDGSADRSWNVISSLSEKDSRVRCIGFSRNFGHQAAITAGLEHAKGDIVVVMDSDLQDPPEVILEMLKKWREGYEVVYGIRTERKGEGILKKLTASFFYHFFRRTTNISSPLEAGDFRLMSRKVVNAVNSLPERVRFIRGLVSWAGFKQVGVPYSRDKRFAGCSKYPLFKMFKLAFDGITSFSIIPLQVASILGLFVTGIAFIIALYSLYIRFFTSTAVKGWTSLLVVIVFLGGIQLVMIGIIGEYLGRIYEEVKRRPLYLVNRTCGLKKKEEVKERV